MSESPWTWDSQKDQANRIKHGFGFDLAIRVFSDPNQLTDPDPYPDEERWRTFGNVGNVLILVVHTDPVFEGEELLTQGRIISSRKATSPERRLYEDFIYG